VRYLLTRDEKKEWSTLASDTQRSAFVEKFWSNLDPTPGDADNPIRREFERRLLFARTKFAANGKPGAASDRAAVFVLLGPPSYVGRARLSSGDTEMDAMRGGVSNATIGGDHRTSNMTAVNGASTNDGLMTDLQRGTREAWYYRKGRLSSAMRYSELHVDFITKEGYGSGVMQREPEILQALGQAADLMRKSTGLN
jgi:GWxTD domain-containing protein